MKLLSVGSLVVLACLSGNFGCGSSSDGFGCTANIDNGIVVTVTDARTHAPIATGAAGTILDGSYTEMLRPFSMDSSGNVLSLAGAPERAGTYTVRITRVGYLPFEKQNVVVTRNACHVNTVAVMAELQSIPVP